jgi:hypothetical protein
VVDVVCDWFSLISDSLTVFQICRDLQDSSWVADGFQICWDLQVSVFGWPLSRRCDCLEAVYVLRLICLGSIPTGAPSTFDSMSCHLDSDGLITFDSRSGVGV